MAMNSPPGFSLLMTKEEIKIIHEASRIVTNLHKRKLYKLVADLINYDPVIIDLFFQSNPSLNQDDFNVINYKIGFVSGNKPDPFANIYFYDKKEEKKSFILKKNQISGILSDNYQERHTLLICKRRNIFPHVMNLWTDFESKYINANSVS